MTHGTRIDVKASGCCEIATTYRNRDRKNNMARKERWLQKAENWLAERARTPDNWSNGEAIVYFMSRMSRRRRSVDQSGIDESAVREHWHAARGSIGSLVAKERIVETHPVTGEDCPVSPRFWDVTTDECTQMTLDATMIRVAEWLGIDGFAETWKRLAPHLCWEANMSEPSDESPAYRLFPLCRSGVALNEMPEAARAFLWALLRRKPSSARPWEIVLHHPDEPAAGGYAGEVVKSVAIAAAVAFATVRNVTDDATMAQQAQGVLVRRQAESGAWPRIGPYLEDVDSVLNTAMAMHALSLAESWPRGAKKALERALGWVHGQQHADGYWAEGGVDPVYLTVLVLDAIQLATGGDTVTLLLSEPPSRVAKPPRKKPGRKAAVPPSAYAEIREAYDRVKTKPKARSLVGEVLDRFAQQYRVNKDTISAIARKKSPYDK